jgi:hypothetical protein
MAPLAAQHTTHSSSNESEGTHVVQAMLHMWPPAGQHELQCVQHFHTIWLLAYLRPALLPPVVVVQLIQQDPPVTLRLAALLQEADVHRTPNLAPQPKPWNSRA